MSYLFFMIIFSAFDVELYQLERAENVWCLSFHFEPFQIVCTDAKTQVSYTLEVDPRPPVFLPGKILKCILWIKENDAPEHDVQNVIWCFDVFVVI